MRKLMLLLSVLVLLSAGASSYGGALTLVSDTSVEVAGPYSTYPLSYGGYKQAMATWVHSAWPKPYDGSGNYQPVIDGATWISTSRLIGEDGGSIPDSSWRVFRLTFELPWFAYSVEGTLHLTADNAEEVYLTRRSRNQEVVFHAACFSCILPA